VCGEESSAPSCVAFWGLRWCSLYACGVRCEGRMDSVMQVRPRLTARHVITKEKLKGIGTNCVAHGFALRPGDIVNVVGVSHVHDCHKDVAKPALRPRSRPLRLEDRSLHQTAEGPEARVHTGLRLGVVQLW
jgi:hypothetical protein